MRRVTRIYACNGKQEITRGDGEERESMNGIILVLVRIDQNGRSITEMPSKNIARRSLLPTLSGTSNEICTEAVSVTRENGIDGVDPFARLPFVSFGFKQRRVLIRGNTENRSQFLRHHFLHDSYVSWPDWYQALTDWPKQQD